MAILSASRDPRHTHTHIKFMFLFQIMYDKLKDIHRLWNMNIPTLNKVSNTKNYTIWQVEYSEKHHMI